jgi:hypothetical protein
MSDLALARVADRVAKEVCSGEPLVSKAHDTNRAPCHSPGANPSAGGAPVLSTSRQARLAASVRMRLGPGALSLAERAWRHALAG